MKTISAEPKNVDAIFGNEFIVPDFQRPYSWDEEDCNQLWEDIVSFHSDLSPDSPDYYLGNIVLYPVDPGSRTKWKIIDGQQRLTTLSLLIRCLLDKAGANLDLEFALKKSLYKLHPDTGKLPRELELRLCSGVETGSYGKDRESFQKVMEGEFAKLDKNNPFRVNYELLLENLSGWWDGKSAEKQLEFTRTLRNKINLLMIECADEDDALTIFERINDRGKPLSDADIFKAKIYRAIPEEHRRDFIDRWSALNNHTDDFRVYMHISRATRGDVGKESALRKYMATYHLGDGHRQELEKDWKSLMDKLKAVDIAWEDYVCSDKKWQSEENIHWEILQTIPNVYWQYPAFVFQNKHGELQDGKASLAGERQGEYIALLENTVRYFFIKGVVHNSVNRVKDGVFKVCKAIAEGGDYTDMLKSSVSSKELEDFHYYLAESEYGRYQRGLVYVNSLQNAKQDREAYANLLVATTNKGHHKCHIEHILPQKWEDYDEWDKTSHREYVGKIGNLIPLEGRINIQATNKFFQAKQKKYKVSKVRDALDLADANVWKHWYSGDVDKRQNESLARLRKFFDAIKK